MTVAVYQNFLRRIAEEMACNKFESFRVDGTVFNVYRPMVIIRATANIMKLNFPHRFDVILTVHRR